MASKNETFPLGTVESILIDGANGISGAPRAHFPEASSSLGLSLAAFALAMGLLWKRRRGALLGVLLIAALPGLWAVLVLRADAPAKRPELAATISSTLEEIQARGAWPASVVQVVREDDDVLFPLGRYAIPGRNPLSAPEVELELRGPLLARGCHQVPSTRRVVCGAGE